MFGVTTPSAVSQTLEKCERVLLKIRALIREVLLSNRVDRLASLPCFDLYLWTERDRAHDQQHRATAVFSHGS
jgi:hypothetical protein